MKVVSAGNFAVLIALVVMADAANVPVHYFEPTRMNEGDRITSGSCICMHNIIINLYRVVLLLIRSPETPI